MNWKKVDGEGQIWVHPREIAHIQRAHFLQRKIGRGGAHDRFAEERQHIDPAFQLDKIALAIVSSELPQL